MSAKHTTPGPRGPEKDPSWFSWRHATNAEHVAARETWLSQHGPTARRRRAFERQTAFDQEVRDYARSCSLPEPDARAATSAAHAVAYRNAQRSVGSR